MSGADSVAGKGARPTVVRAFAPAAADAIAGWSRGGRVVGVTRGSFSLIDLLRATLEVTGPGHVSIAAWTTGIRDAEVADWLVKSGKILSLRWLIDRSFATRQPAYCDAVTRRFGADALVVTMNHAKFFTVETADGWRAVCRSSMNLNTNRRLEQFDLDDDAEVFALFNGLVDEFGAKSPRGLAPDGSVVNEVFEAIASAPVADRAGPHGAGGKTDEARAHRQAAAAMALAAGASVEAAADAAAVSKRTVERWKASDPDFRRTLADTVGRVSGRFVHLAEVALGHIDARLADPATAAEITTRDMVGIAHMGVQAAERAVVAMAAGSGVDRAPLTPEQQAAAAEALREMAESADGV